MHHVMHYCAEYDENGCVWLVDTATKARIALEHGAVLHLTGITPPSYSQAETKADETREEQR